MQIILKKGLFPQSFLCADILLLFVADENIVRVRAAVGICPDLADIHDSVAYACEFLIDMDPFHTVGVFFHAFGILAAPEFLEIKLPSVHEPPERRGRAHDIYFPGILLDLHDSRGETVDKCGGFRRKSERHRRIRIYRAEVRIVLALVYCLGAERLSLADLCFDPSERNRL